MCQSRSCGDECTLRRREADDKRIDGAMVPTSENNTLGSRVFL